MFEINLLSGHVSNRPRRQTAQIAKNVVEGIGAASEEKDGLMPGADKAKLDTVMPGAAQNMLSVTWAALVALRNESNLVPGMFYRITDYTTTTTQVDTRSAGHVFDIIVRADSENILNENAFAVQHEGDTYFAKSKLAAWQLKYCLDNDLSRFAWADVEDGKGVIFFMRDEFNNEAPYDFKNIQYKRYKTTEGDYAGEYLAWSGDTFVWAYTFSLLGWDDENEEATYNTILDATVENYNPNYDYDSDGGGYAHPIVFCEDNKIGKTISAITIDDEDLFPSVLSLSYNVFFSKPEIFDETGIVEVKHCAKNILKDNCAENLFIACCGNIFGNACKGNTFCSDSHNNVFNDDCCWNWFSERCTHNRFEAYCWGNQFEAYCQWNSFKEGCYRNKFEANCYSNGFNKNCWGNKFEAYCQYNQFEANCGRNQFEANCRYNQFEANCQYNKFEANCWSNKFEANVSNIKILANCFCNNIIYSGVQYVDISCADTGTGNVQNVMIYSGIKGTYNSYIEIEIPTRGGSLVEVKPVGATIIEI